jgi:uncharacterized membrane protein YebE (DUF533 family)
MIGMAKKAFTSVAVGIGVGTAIAASAMAVSAGLITAPIGAGIAAVALVGGLLGLSLENKVSMLGGVSAIGTLATAQYGWLQGFQANLLALNPV